MGLEWNIVFYFSQNWGKVSLKAFFTRGLVLVLWVFILAKNVYHVYLKVFNIYHFVSFDILAQGKIQNSHSPFYSMFHNIELCSLKVT